LLFRVRLDGLGIRHGLFEIEMRPGRHTASAATEPARSAPRTISLDGSAIDDYAHATLLTLLLMLQPDSAIGS
jgi:hypothetical protein